jgi:hypothetical protein
MISDMLNIHLEHHGHVARVDPETLERRGIAREPEPKLRPSESAAYRKGKVVGETMGKVLNIRQVRTKTRTKEQNQAYQVWEARKEFLGIHRAMAKEEKLTRILLKRHGSADRVPPRYRRRAEAIARPSRRQVGPSMVAELRDLLARLEVDRGHGRGMRVHVEGLAPEEGTGLGR